MTVPTPAAPAGRLFVLEISTGSIQSMNPDGSDAKTVVSGARLPDGVAVDTEAGHLYWTNMGSINVNDGSIERADLDGRNRTVIVQPGFTHTPKQLHLDKAGGKLYWCDREGMRVMRANLDGTAVETLVETGRGDIHRRDQKRWCVGITVDRQQGHIYWSQKGPDNGGQGRICRAGMQMPPGECADSRSDIEVVFDHLPEPIDLELDPTERLLYWTDRGNPPTGNTVSRAAIDTKHVPQIVMSDLMEGIGLALDLRGKRLFVSDLAGSIHTADLDGGHRHTLRYAMGNLTGIAYAEA